MLKIILASTCAFAAGIALVVACGNGTTPADAADAGSCDCPTFESRIRRFSTTSAFAAGAPQNSGGINCAAADKGGPGAIAIGGRCYYDNDAALIRSGVQHEDANNSIFTCSWSNEKNYDGNEAIIDAICLVPAN
jgi:hypothetical protein